MAEAVDLDDKQSRHLVIHLTYCAERPEHEVWREKLNGRWVVFLRYAEQTYCLLPLWFSTVSTVSTERAASD